MRTSWAKRCMAALVLAASGFLFGCAAGSVSVKAGPALAGREDVRLNGEEIRGQSPTVGPAVAIGFAGWHKSQGPSIGFGADLVGLCNDLEVSGVKIEEERLGILGNVLGRYPLPRFDEAYVYGGVTGGGFLARLNGGGGEFGPAVGLRLGVSFPLLRRLEFVLEADYLFFADVNGRATDGSRMKASGSGSFADGLRGPHGDAMRFVVKGGVNLLVWE